MNKFLDNLISSGIVHITIVFFIIGSTLKSCEQKKRQARLECIKTQPADICRLLIVN